jgi:hypothetical protein
MATTMMATTTTTMGTRRGGRRGVWTRASVQAPPTTRVPPRKPEGALNAVDRVARDAARVHGTRRGVIHSRDRRTVGDGCGVDASMGRVVVKVGEMMTDDARAVFV